MPNNIIKAHVEIQGTRPLLQCQFTEYAIPLPEAKREKTGVAGNDPEEWKRSCMVADNGQLYLRGDYVTGMFIEAAIYQKKSKGSIQPEVRATLQTENDRILVDRFMPKKAWPLEPTGKCSVPRDPEAPVFIHVSGVINPGTKKRNVRYRLACSPGWKVQFTIFWDKTILNRRQMESVLIDAGRLVGLGNGRKIGYGRFVPTKFEVIDAPQEAAA